MTLAALICAYHESGEPGDGLRATLPLAGRTVVERQARLAAAAGADSVIILVERLPPALIAAIDRMRGEGVRAIVARGVAEAAESVQPEDRLLLVSDGRDTASDVTPTELKQKLVRSDVFLYAIGIDTLDARNSTRINPFTLQELTSQGGGYTEIIRSTEALGPATERIAEELNHQYMLGYTPKTRADGTYHSVRVRVVNKTYTVRARRGVVR